jgi:hypothetical protein
VQTVVERASDIAKNVLDSSLVLHHGSLHELANEADSERQIRASVHQVAQTTDQAPVVSVIRDGNGHPKPEYPTGITR